MILYTSTVRKAMKRLKIMIAKFSVKIDVFIEYFIFAKFGVKIDVSIEYFILPLQMLTPEV